MWNGGAQGWRQHQAILKRHDVRTHRRVEAQRHHVIVFAGSEDGAAPAAGSVVIIVASSGKTIPRVPGSLPPAPSSRRCNLA